MSLLLLHVIMSLSCAVQYLPSKYQCFGILLAKDDYSDSKRRRVAVARPKSPSSTPPPATREEKNDMSSSKSTRQQGVCVCGEGACNSQHIIYFLFDVDSSPD